jgi:hypothetical protein
MTPHRPRPRTRRRWTLVGAIGALALVATLFVLLEHISQPTGPAASVSTHHAARPQTAATTRTGPKETDAEGSAIRALATSLAHGGLPGDGALASALEGTAAQRPGADRQSSALQVLSLAQVLLDGGGITAGQFQDVVNVLQPTGATVTTTTVTLPSPSLLGPFFSGHGHGHDGGDRGGGQG